MLEKVKQNLSTLEQQILEMFLQGYSYVEIGEKFGCSAKKCDNILQKIKKKLSD